VLVWHLPGTHFSPLGRLADRSSERALDEDDSHSRRHSPLASASQWTAPLFPALVGAIANDGMSPQGRKAKGFVGMLLLAAPTIFTV